MFRHVSAPPKRSGKGAALVIPRCDTEAMNLHLAEIATQIAPGARAALLVDQAGWHLSRRLIVPPNITLIPLPAKCPELNPHENVWQFMRERSRIGSSNLSTTSSTIAATPGTSSPISPGGSCRSAYAMGPDQRVLGITISLQTEAAASASILPQGETGPDKGSAV